ncbi:MAG: PDZ domain-containing protein [Proteobacteria bacterium]|nr:PDZ domain-containing protein [Pseudomonadota bacterium]
MKKWIGTAVLVLVLGLAIAGSAGATDAVEQVRAFEEVLVQVVETTQPAVVTLEVSGSEKHGLPGLERFMPVDGMGTGFIIEADGTILTNHHVVDGADRIDVLLADGRRFKAEVIATSAESDVGVIRMIDAPEGLPIAQLGTSEDLRIGQYAIALGAPLGYDRSVTFGHVSGLHRASVGRQMGPFFAPGFEHITVQDFIQVDTPINPGNSGGPLVDLDGRVIGINSAIADAPGGGMGFAIPIDLATKIAKQLIANGKVTVGDLGVRMTDNNPSLDEVWGRSIGQGALITEVYDGGSAARAGMEEDDVVVTFADRKIRTEADLMSAYRTAPVGTPVQLTAWRTERGEDVLKTMTVTLEARTLEPGAASTEAHTLKPGPGKWIARELGLTMGSDGKARNPNNLVVRSIVPHSKADQAGLEIGDVVVALNDVEVDSDEEFQKTLLGTSKEFVPLVVERGGKKQYLAIERP